jgi:uncharacterized protein
MLKILLFIIVFTISISSVFGECLNKEKLIDRNPSDILFHVPDTRQSANYSCGATAFQAVLCYWGIDIEENELIDLLNTSTDYGTDEMDIVRVAKQMGLEAELKDNLTLMDLEESINKGVPVIVDCQSWKSSIYSNVSWSDDWYDGHYMVVIGIDENNIYLEDPYTLGSRGFIPRKEFLERWHNPGGTAPLYNEKQYHLGIFIRGDRPSPSRQFVRIQ